MTRLTGWRTRWPPTPTAPDDRWAIEATRNAIPGQDITGITWGDLRALLEQLRHDQP